jgi:L-lactate dehydrogenase complex protein LldF
VFLVIVDGGRSKVYADPEFREVLQCIKCGSCLNSCPVWTKVGGYAYGWVYSGPIGAVLNPLLVGEHRAKDLYFATSLCGTCKSVCPAGVDHPKLLLKHRERRAKGDKTFGAKKPPLTERLVTSVWSWGLKGDGRYRLGSRFFRLAVRPFVRNGKLTNLPEPGRGFTKVRELPAPPKKTFRDRWRDSAELKNGR